MTREEVIRTLTRLKNQINFEWTDAQKKMDALNIAIEALQGQRWIPCSERLPEEDKEVLITYRYKEGEGDQSNYYINITTYGDYYFGGRKCGFKEWRAPFEYFHSNYEVVAWMPLPEPYKEEKDETN